MGLEDRTKRSKLFLVWCGGTSRFIVIFTVCEFKTMAHELIQESWRFHNFPLLWNRGHFHLHWHPPLRSTWHLQVIYQHWTPKSLLCHSPRCWLTPLTGEARMCFDNQVVSLANCGCSQAAQWRKLWLSDQDRTSQGLSLSEAHVGFILRLLFGFVPGLCESGLSGESKQVSVLLTFVILLKKSQRTCNTNIQRPQNICSEPFLRTQQWAKYHGGEYGQDTKSQSGVSTPTQMRFKNSRYWVLLVLLATPCWYLLCAGLHGRYFINITLSHRKILAKLTNEICRNHTANNWQSRIWTHVLCFQTVCLFPPSQLVRLLRVEHGRVKIRTGRYSR